MKKHLFLSSLLAFFMSASATEILHTCDDLTGAQGMSSHRVINDNEATNGKAIEVDYNSGNAMRFNFGFDISVPLNIKMYVDENGYFEFKIKASDVRIFQDFDEITMELSSGNSSSGWFKWNMKTEIQTANTMLFNNEWITIRARLSTASWDKGTGANAIDWTQVRYFRMFFIKQTTDYNQVKLYIDDLRAVMPDEPIGELIPFLADEHTYMISECNTLAGQQGLSVRNVVDNVAASGGKAIMMRNNPNNRERYNFGFTFNPIDLTQFVDNNGFLEIRFMTDNAAIFSQFDEVTMEISSNNATNGFFKWNIKTEILSAGTAIPGNNQWFNVKARLNTASWNKDLVNPTNWSNICYFRILFVQNNNTGYETARLYIDDVRVTMAASYIPPEEPANIALGKNVYTSDFYGNVNDFRKMTDGSNGSYWTSSDASGQAAWVTVDLEKPYLLNRFVMETAGAAGLNNSLNIKTMKVQASIDGGQFKTVAEVTSNTSNSIIRSINAYGRYVRFWINDAGNDKIPRIAEIRISGEELNEEILVANGLARKPLAEPNPRIMNTVNQGEDYVLAVYSASDAAYNLDLSGSADVSDKLQRMLDDCAQTGGGTVFLPVGKYRITKSINIPTHVTLRGDWKDPDLVSNGDYGTIIIADVASTTAEFPGLFRLHGSSGVRGITVFYPNQNNINNVKQYPYTFEFPGYAGSNTGEGAFMSQSLIDITLINAYRGISSGYTDKSRNGNNEVHFIKNIKGTCLKEGVLVTNCSDTGRTQDIYISTDYWHNAGAAFNAPTKLQLDVYTRENLIGVQFGDTEWETVYNVNVDNAFVGLDIIPGPRIAPVVELFKLRVENCIIGVRIQDVDKRAGFQLANAVIKTVDYRKDAVAVLSLCNTGKEVDTQIYEGSALFQNCTLDAGIGQLVRIEKDMVLNFQNCTFGTFGSEYAVENIAGRLVIEGSTFSQEMTEENRGILAGQFSKLTQINSNQFTGNASFFTENTGGGKYAVDNSNRALPKLDVADHKKFTGNLKPGTNLVFVASKAPYFAPNNGYSDASAAIQQALNDAGNAGGGTVFLPTGYYRLEQTLNVPANVEIRGIDDVSHRADGKGTTFFVTHGAGATLTTSDQLATITLNAGAGIRGVNFFYPLQTSAVSPYPWAIRGNGDDVYAVDVTFANGFRGVDFSGNYSAPCNGHYIRYVSGALLHDGISVGKSDEGWVESVNYNVSYWVRTDLPHWMAEPHNPNWSVPMSIINDYIANNATMLAFGACGDEHVLNIAMYGGETAYKFYKQNGVGANVVLINVPADGVGRNIVVNGSASKGIKIINSVLNPLFGTTGRNGITITDGKAHIYNSILIDIVGTGIDGKWNDALNVTGGEIVVQGTAFNDGNVNITGGTGVVNGVVMKGRMRTEIPDKRGFEKNASAVIYHTLQRGASPNILAATTISWEKEPENINATGFSRARAVLNPQSCGKVYYTSNNPAVASVHWSGIITGLSNGTATITASSAPNGEGVSISKQINVSNATTNYAWQNAPENMNAGDEMTVSAAHTPTGIFTGTNSFYSNNPSVATIDENTAVLKAVSDGIATIYGIDNQGHIVYKDIAIGNVTDIVETHDEQTIFVYPNPVKDILHIESPAHLQKIILFDVNGKIIYVSEKTDKINMSSFAKGIYILKIVSENNVSEYKIVKI